MATATQTEKTFPCLVTFGSHWIEVQGKSSTLRLDVGPCSQGWTWFSAGEQQFLRSLTQGDPDDATTNLTVSQMKLFKACVEKFAARNAKETNKKAADAAVSKTAKGVHANVTGNAHQQTTTTIDEAEHKIKALQGIADSLKDEEFFQLEYDIPTGRCPNPSHRCTMPEGESGWVFPGMWCFGYRRTLSCWVLPKKSIEHPEMLRAIRCWESLGCDVEVIPYSAAANDKVRAIARQKLDEEIRRQHTSLIECIAAADEALAKAAAETTSAEDQEAAEKYRDNTVRTKLRTAGDMLNAAIQCAEMFDQTENVSELLAGLRKALVARTQAFNVIARKKGIKEAPKV